MRPQTIRDSNDFLDNLAYEGGFGADDVIKQSKIGLVVQKNTIDTATLNQNSAVTQRYHENALMPFGSAQTFERSILAPVTAKAVLYNDLITRGCVARFPMGTYLARYAKSNLPESPVTAMDQVYQDGRSNAPQSQGDFIQDVVPMPVQFYDYMISKRQIAASQNTSSIYGGYDLQTQEMRTKAIGLIDARERLLWNGNKQIIVNSQPLYGVLTHPVVVDNAVNITFSRSQPALLINALLTQALQAIANQDYDMSDIVIYYSQNMLEFFNQDYVTQSAIAPALTVRQRLLNIGGIVDVKATSYLNPEDKSLWDSEGKIVIIKMDPNVIDVAVESDIAMAQYADSPAFVRMNMFSICAARVKVDYNGKYGISLINVTITP